jgi:predicted small lipoprotein YifL
MERQTMRSRRAKRLILALAIAPLLAGALAGCGRKGPLELPPDVQAARQEKIAEQQADQAAKNPDKGKLSQQGADAKAATGGQGPKLSQQGVKPKARPVEGDVGHRPPADYPFFLDPIL